jgi:hypothetical protein
VGPLPFFLQVIGFQLIEIFYEIGDNPLINTPSLAGNSLVVPARDVLHVKLDTRRNPLIGETWLSALAPELGMRNAMHNASAAFSNNMSRPSGVITTDLQIKKEDRDELRNRWNEQAKGLNTGGVPILTHGMKFQPISISNESASECAGSVDMTRVRWPERAARNAVAAATVVFPTPPFPVNRSTRTGLA